ncbi:L,D-transpeptidase [Streptomyces sp. NPDC002454]|uniref:L,D-transpeptidase n=1 Tax=Streptomyces sp. NPDC002490 TaxID=3154416 RepID=UPI00333329A7
MSQHHTFPAGRKPLAVLAALSAAAVLSVQAVVAGGSPAVALPRAECDLRTGPYQEAAEDHLSLPGDGVQSADDCEAIRQLQVRNGRTAADGYAGVETWRIIQFERAAAQPSSLVGCGQETGVVVCVDLTRQVLWVRDGTRVLFGPVPVRSGMPGYATRTGRFAIYQRVEEQWSDLYDGPMPFSQFFSGGQALHGSYREIWEEPGSHGCVNLRYRDAERLWRALRVGDAVRLWGERDG